MDAVGSEDRILSLVNNKEKCINKCVLCGGTVVERKVTFMYDDEGKHLFVENVPAEVCTRCGERTYSSEVTDELLSIANNQSKPMKTIAVPVFDFQRAVA